MKKELRIIFTAIMFYTRIPCPKWVGHDAYNLNLATRYFPFIGWIVGLISWLIFIVGQYFFSPEISMLLSIAGGVLVTGAFHEDGFADVCDGFGGGWTKEKILLIMKDSRVGTYAVIGLILILLLKFYSMDQLSSHATYQFGLMLVTAHSLSRLAAVGIIFTSRYVREDAGSKVKPVAEQLSVKNFMIAIFWVMIPLGLLGYFNYIFLLIIIPTLAVTLYLRRYYTKWIGGFTGDCLGAVQQVTEVVIYLSLLVVWKFI